MPDEIEEIAFRPTRRCKHDFLNCPAIASVQSGFGGVTLIVILCGASVGVGVDIDRR